MKTLVIAEHRAKELANCMWNDMSILSYGMEIKARVINMTFIEHHCFSRYLHAFLARCVDVITRKTCSIWATGSPKFLPPTVAQMGRYGAYKQLFFFGWLFRNPAGLKKYRTELMAKFAPSMRVQRYVRTVLSAYPRNKMLVGIHMRQKPFKGFENEEFLISPMRVQEIVNEYLLEHHLKKEDIALIEVSDLGEQKDDLTGLHLLSKCSVVIGTNSTFSNLAAWFGNVPHVVTTDEPIDWTYYRGKSTYFDNKYATFTHGSLVYP